MLWIVWVLIGNANSHSHMGCTVYTGLFMRHRTYYIHTHSKILIKRQFIIMMFFVSFSFVALHFFPILIVNIYIVLRAHLPIRYWFCSSTSIRICINAQLNNQLKILIGIKVVELDCTLILRHDRNLPLFFIFIGRFLETSENTNFERKESFPTFFHISLLNVKQIIARNFKVDMDTI